MKKVLCLAAVLLLVVGLLPAQTLYHVCPTGNATVEGNSNNTYPFYNRAFTYMQIHDDLLVRPMLISRLAWRGDYNYSRAAFSPTVSAWLSTAVTTATTASSTFASNHGTDKALVVNQVTLNFPATVSGTGPRPFTHFMPLTTPFLYKGTGVGSLAWEVSVLKTTSTGSTPLDAVSQASVGYSRSYVGTGGMASGQTRTSYNYSYVAAGGGGLLLYGAQYYCGINETPFMWIGINDQRWGPFKLPFDLSPLGGKGNNIYCDMLILQVGTGKTDTKGYYYWSSSTEGIPIPADPVLLNAPYFMQHGSTDMKNPAFPFVFTRACKMQLTSLPGKINIVRIYNSSSATATTGSMSVGSGLVTQFEYK